MSDDTTQEVALEVKEVRLGYGDLTAVWNVDLQAQAGRTMALLGRNGAGKTTLLSGIAGLLPAKAGTVQLHGRDITSMAPWHRVEHGLGLVQEGKRIFRNLTVAENIAVSVPRTVARSKRAEAIERTWDRFPVLAERQAQRGGELSGGQQQMLSIASAIVGNPSVLLVDEPSSGLSPLAVAQVFEVIDDLKREGLAILLVEQNVEEVLSGFADDVAVIDQGRIVMRGEAGTISVKAISDIMFGVEATAIVT
ncbi:ABC transporter ATP-binding protein [Aeromicrobium sp. UC242_57]|uniref:ABC transporter ATP-binding protein n=1 Tax=Aeromicrobium sp. UC242_57 TaxID=3374624 RepID=UPI0037A4799F